MHWTNRLSNRLNQRLLLGMMCLLGIGSFLLWTGLSQAAYNGFQVEPHAIPLEDILAGGPPKDGIPALTNPKFITADQADFLSAQDRILGIHIKNQAKAYPILILNWHEIVNDTVGGTPLVITYCPLCGSGIGFLRKVGEHLLTFGVSGLLYQSDVLMYDHQTESLWSQMAMQAVTGKSLGNKLEPIFVEHTTWGVWRRKYSDTLVLSIDTGYTREYRQDAYANYALTDRLMFPIGRHDDQYPPKEWVLGVEVSGKFKGYPFSEMEKTDRSFWDSLNGQDYTVCWDSANRSAKVIDDRGSPLPSFMSYWFAWYTFHPDTEIFMGLPNPSGKEMKSMNGHCSATH